jgi:hypothetical protein
MFEKVFSLLLSSSLLPPLSVLIDTAEMIDEPSLLVRLFWEARVETRRFALLQIIFDEFYIF